MRHGFQSRSSSCRNKKGEVLTNNTNVLKRWKEYLFSVLKWRGEDQLELHAYTFAEIWEKDKKISIPNRE